jgi:hypothetical protein
MGLGGKILRVGALGVVVVALLGVAWARSSQPGEGTFCTMGLAIFVIDGQEVLPQDQSKPGRDGCDSDDTLPRAKVLGFDCRIREPDGDVVAKLVPNRSDGTCGLPGSDGSESVPDPWPKA